MVKRKYTAALILASAAMFAAVFVLTVWWRSNGPLNSPVPDLPLGGQPLADGGQAPAAAAVQPDPGPSAPTAGSTAPSADQTRPTADDPVPVQPPPSPADMVWPVAGEVIGTYGWTYSETMADWRHHAGLDIAATAGGPVAAVLPGTVTNVRDDAAWGWLVEVAHGPGYRSLYANCERILVEEGDHVAAGDHLARVGSSALLETGPEAHLHFELVWEGDTVDPLTILAP